MSDWEAKAFSAAKRKETLMSFGINARGVLVQTPHGYFVVDPEDSSVSSRLLNEGTYADNEISVIQSIIGSDSDILVVGTHIGAHVVRLSKICKNLVGIEANPNTYRLLEANVNINQCLNVQCFNVAASDKNEKINFLLSRENSGGSKRTPLIDHVHYIYDSPQTIEIDAAPLDDILVGRIFEFILMDIEGSEYFALKGMQKILHNTSCLAVEFLPWHLRDVANVTVEEFLDQIFPHFYFMFDEKYNEISTGDASILKRLKAIYDVSEGHDLIYFFKRLDGEWIRNRSASMRPSWE